MPHTFDALDPDPRHLIGVIGLQVLDPDQNPNRVLQTNLDWKIRVDWNISGLIAGRLGVPQQMAAFAEGPVVQFYKPGP